MKTDEKFTVGNSVFTYDEMADICREAPDDLISDEFLDRALDCGCEINEPPEPQEPDVDLDLLIDGLACIKVGQLENGIRLLELGIGKTNTLACDSSLVRVRRIPL